MKIEIDQSGCHYCPHHSLLLIPYCFPIWVNPTGYEDYMFVNDRNISMSTGEDYRQNKSWSSLRLYGPDRFWEDGDEEYIKKKAW